MPFNTNDTTTYREDVSTKGQTMSTSDRSAMLDRYLPSPEEIGRKRATNLQQSTGKKQRIRPFLKQKVYFLLYWTIQFIFGIYLRFRQVSSAISQKYIAIRHYHHRTPAYIQKDLKNLDRLPQHLSILLKYDANADDGLETLLDEVAELSAWSSAAGIPLLSVYEKHGILKTYMSAVQELVQQKLVQYFGRDSCPHLHVSAPNLPSLTPVVTPDPRPQRNGTNGTTKHEPQTLFHLLLLSETDGRDTLVDLTRTLAEMAQSRKLRPKDITAELIDAEIQATTSVSLVSQPSTKSNGRSAVKNYNELPPSEPDLLIVFAPYVKLDGYPPWQLRLTEIFCVGDSGGDVSGRNRTRVEYQGFLRALWNFAGAQFRFGR